MFSWWRNKRQKLKCILLNRILTLFVNVQKMKWDPLITDPLKPHENKKHVTAIMIPLEDVRTYTAIRGPRSFS